MTVNSVAHAALDHPELDAEQRFVTRAYELLDRGLADVEHTYETYQEGTRATAAALRRALDILRNSRGSGQLVFGRVDQDGDQLYIGRRRVHDESKELVVASWHAPAAQVFYEATPDDPHGLELKRVFVEQDRVLAQVVDEIVAGAAGDVVTGEGDQPTLVSDALLLELERSRDGAMREVVATIQAEQFRIIRAPRDQVLVVQGGPGTGKTVVGLHRAAWHAFNDDELRRAGILVVAPSSALLSFTSGVLPSLDASDVLQVDLPSLYAGEAVITAGESLEEARVKGSVAMAHVLERALQNRRGWTGGDLELSLGGARATLSGARIQELLDDAAGRDLPHNQARDVLRQALSSAAYGAYVDAQRASGRPAIATEPAIRRLSTFSNALDRMWPSYTPEELLRNLYGTQTWLVEATSGLLTPDQRSRLFREPQVNISDERWTPSDLFCLDELSFLLNGEIRTYGHVVVDEAQDLSPMQARALARRCPSGSFTVLGDLAQATGAWIRDSWSELTGLLGTGSAAESLTIGYRVPSAALDLASRLLPLISPGLEAPLSLRLGAGEPTVHLEHDESPEQTALSVAAQDVSSGLTTAIVVTDALFGDLLERCREEGRIVGNGREGDFSQPLTIVPASLVKGLEFDSVVVLGPTELVDATIDGRRLLYIAMTRCTQVLRLVDDRILPEGLDHLAPRHATVPEPVGEPATDSVDDEFELETGEDDLDTLVDSIAELDEADREVVAMLVRRLLKKGHE